MYLGVTVYNEKSYNLMICLKAHDKYTLSEKNVMMLVISGKFDISKQFLHTISLIEVI